MRAVDIIRKKRDGHALARDEIKAFVDGATSGSWPEYQLSALLMAIVLRGMSPAETALLTSAMIESGVRLNLSHMTGTKVDKHSTGGVGDKTSLIIAPLVAACGVLVPMMSGRGLAHTGGTLDKLESIPGFRVALSLTEFQQVLERVHCALIGQTSDIAPADKKLYALRDVTGTVESIPLISASIMSKKIAEGIDALLVDVKVGSGAFMKSLDDARQLARSLVDIGKANGVRTEAVLTRMEEPLGRAVGNALEVIESLETLKGRGPADLETVSVALAGRLLVLAGAAPSRTEGERQIRETLSSGAGVEKFKQIISAQGGDPSIVDRYDRLPAAPHRHHVVAQQGGHLTRLDAELIGRATTILGAGRSQVDQPIDHSVGAIVFAKRGARVARGDPICELHYRDEEKLAAALPLVTAAIQVADAPVASEEWFLGEVV